MNAHSKPKAILFIIFTLLALTPSCSAATANPTTNPVYINNTQVDLSSYTIDGYTYFRLRDLAEALHFQVDYDSATRKILVQNSVFPDLQTPAVPSSADFGDPELTAPAFNIDTLLDSSLGEAETDAEPKNCMDGKLVILLDAGHGGTDRGSSSIDLKYCERDLNIIVAEKVKAILETNGIQTLMLRSSEETANIGKEERIARLDYYTKNYPVDLLLSIHHNATEQHTATGSEVLVQIAYEHGGTGQELAQCIEAQYRALGRKIRPTKYQHSSENPDRDRLYLLANAYDRGLLAVISEYCFLDVESDLQWVSTEQGLTNEANALANAVLQYFSSHPY